MATSGTKTFALDTGEAIEEAYELAGLEARTGYDAATARRSLNIMFADWSNRGINIWTIAQVSLTLTESTASYTLNAYDIDILEAVIRRTVNGQQTDYQVNRIGRMEYLNIPNKTTEARPTEFFVDRQTTPVLKLWPTPENSTDIFVSYRIQRIDDASASAQDQEVPSRFIPPMVSGLAYYIALKKNPERVPMLLQIYEQDLRRAQDEDRGRASLHLVPRATY
tara:strand:+ start:894 stop:1562 length:669 start_codon:yes stop_codon:yes gene_type:complete